VRYVGSTFDDALNTASTPAFTLFDAAIHYDSGHWRFALNGNNNANKKYVATFSSGYAWGAKRSVVLSAKYRW
jgi:iron complex outermembrane receptor protein